jgi:hypothetical protein
MRWPFRYKGDLPDPEGKAQAKRQLEEARHQYQVAQAIAQAAHQSAQEHRRLLRENNFRDNIRARALEVRRS